MLASTRRISLCIFCISGSTPDNDASAGDNKIKRKLLAQEFRPTAQLKPAHCRRRNSSFTSVRARNHRFDSSGGDRTRGEHLVDVLESAGLIHFSCEISAPRARARRIWRGLEGSGRGGRRGGPDLAGHGQQAATRAREGMRWRERWNRRRVLAVVGSSAVQRVAPRPS
jgi:hypothetical protein